MIVFALGYIKMTKGFLKVVGTHTFGDVHFCVLELSVLEGEHAEVCVGFGGIGIDAERLTEIALCAVVVALLHGDHDKVVVGAVVIGLVIVSFDENVLLLGVGVDEDIVSIEKLFKAEFGWVGVNEGEDFIVATTNHVVIDDHASTTEFRKNGIGKFFINDCHITDFTLALFWVFVHGEDTEDEVFVGQVGGCDEGLEAFPVFCREFCIDVGSEFLLFELLVYIVFGDRRTFLGKFLVEGVSTIG